MNGWRRPVAQQKAWEQAASLWEERKKMLMPDKGRVKGVAREEESVTIAAKNLHSDLLQRERERESEKKALTGCRQAT